MRLLRHDGEYSRQFCLRGVGICFELLDTWLGCGFCWQGRDLKGLASQSLVDEVRECGVEEEGEDLGERGRFDEVGGLVEEAAEGGGAC